MDTEILNRAESYLPTIWILQRCFMIILTLAVCSTVNLPSCTLKTPGHKSLYTKCVKLLLDMFEGRRG